jgi:hypothetical protein
MLFDIHRGEKPCIWSVKGNLSERVFLFETFIILSPKIVIFSIDNCDLVVLKVVVFQNCTCLI